MAASMTGYGKFLSHALKKEVNLLTDNVKVMLVGTGYTFDIDAHEYKSNVSGEISSAGYTAGGATLGSPTITYDVATNEVRFDAADVSWSGLTATIRGAVLYVDISGADSVKPLLAYYDFGGDQVCSGVNFSIAWNENGIMGYRS